MARRVVVVAMSERYVARRRVLLQCGHDYEVVGDVKVSEFDAIAACPTCGVSKVTRVVGLGVEPLDEGDDPTGLEASA